MIFDFIEEHENVNKIDQSNIDCLHSELIINFGFDQKHKAVLYLHICLSTE